MSAGKIPSTDLQAINRTQEFCQIRRLKINVEKKKIVIFKKGGKLSNNEKCRVGKEEIKPRITLNF
jgi:hypothetical protein